MWERAYGQHDKMPRTKTKTQNNTTTRRPPIRKRRKRHSEKKLLWLCFLLI